MSVTIEKFKTFKNKMKKPTKELFWVWIAYQSIKGVLTLSLIWIPALLFWLDKN